MSINIKDLLGEHFRLDHGSHGTSFGGEACLLDEMLPAEPLMVPVVSLEDAKVICAAPEGVSYE